MATLSLCMIVKNEEEMLAGCLESAKGCVDEMIVVDTGSTDRTKEIATELGAKVYDFEWIEDFAAARNFAKSKCSSDYVLALDADERLSTDEADFLRQEVDKLNPKHNVIFVILSNAKSRHSSVADVLSGKARQASPVLLPRILKNVEGNDWFGAIHESPRLDNGTFGRIDVNIVHLGGDLEWRASRQKSKRNLDMLLERRDQNENTTPLFWSYLASEFYNAGRKKEFLEALEEGWKGLQEAIKNKTITNNGMLSVYPSLLLQQGKVKEGLEALKFLIVNFHYASPNPANLLYYCACALMEVDIPQEFRDDVYDALIDIANILLDWDGEAFLDETAWGITNEKAYHILAFAHLKKKQVDEADEAIAKGFEYNPESYGLRLLQIENNLERGDIQACLAQIMEELDKDINLGPDIWVLAATACVVLGYEDDAQDFLNQARFRAQLQFVGRHRIALLKGLLARHAVLSGEPISGKGMYGVLGAILSRTPIRSTTPVPNDIIKKVLHRLLELGKVEQIERFFDARAERILPGIRDLVIAYLAELDIKVEDDGVLSPIFLVGYSAKEVMPLFSGDAFSVIEFDSAVSDVIQEKWLDHETELSEAFLFGDLSFLDDEEEEEQETQGFAELRAYLTEQISGKLVKGTRPVVFFDDVFQWATKLSELFPKSVFIYYSVDPRVLASRDDISLETELEGLMSSWKQEHDNALFLGKLDDQKYVVLSNTTNQSNERHILENLFARLGEVYDENALKAWQKIANDVDLEQKYDDMITDRLQVDLERWGLA